MPRPHRRWPDPRELRVVGLVVLIYVVIVVRHGWMAEDTYISLRTAENFLAGDGLVWNVGERVQSFTHPLWLFLCIAVRTLTGEYFYSLIVFGALVSTAAIAILSHKLARSSHVAVALVTAAVLSHAFVDYSTSGLENPLTHLLLALSVWVYLGRVPSARQFGLLCLLGGLALLSRPDNGLLLGPLVVAAGVQAYRRGERVSALVEAAALASAPLILWELFSLFYYGALVPNTALAKLDSGVAAGELAHQGILYLVSTLDADPLTLVVIIAGIVAPFATRDRRTWPLALGVALHVAYVVKIGGDYMLGRFLTAPMFLALICLARVPRVQREPALIIAACVVVLGLSTGTSTLAIKGDSGVSVVESRGHRQITDIRGQLWDTASLLSAKRTDEMPVHGWIGDGRRGPRKGRSVEVRTALGYRGFASDRSVHWIDQVGLSDPLLARLPPTYTPVWMAGHFRRRVPKGYEASIEQGQNLIEDPQIRQLYARVDLVTHGELWTRERLRAIWWLNTGGPARVLDEEALRFAGASRRTPASLSASRVPDGTSLASKRARSFPDTGVSVRYEDRQRHQEVEVSLNDSDRFELRFYDGDEEIARVSVPVKLAWKRDGLAARRLALPPILEDRGFTRLRILPRTKVQDDAPHYAIGHLLFDEEIGPV